MRRFSMLTWVLAVTVLLASTPAHAGKLVELGLGGGMSVPVGDTGDAFDSGFHVRGFVHAKPPMLPFGLRGALGYQRFDMASLPVSQTGKAEMLSGLANVTLELIPFGPVRPYVTAGLGAFHVKGEVDSMSTQTKISETKFGIDAGAGVKLRLGAIKAFAEARFENAFTDQGINPALNDPKSIKVVPVTFGLVF